MCEDACSCTKKDRRLVLRTLGVYNKYEKCQQIWYDRIIEGDKTFKDVPAKLKDSVKESLTEKGHPELAK